MRQAWFWAALVGLVLLGAAAPAFWQAAPAAGPAVPEGLAAGQRLPGFSLTGLDGGAVGLERFRGKAVVLNYWATWCEPCRIEMPHLERAHTDLGRDVAVIGINLKEGDALIRPYLAEQRITYPVLVDQDGAYWSRLKLTGLPSTYVLDAEGIVCRRFVGILSYPLLQQAVAAAQQGCRGAGA